MSFLCEYFPMSPWELFFPGDIQNVIFIKVLRGVEFRLGVTS